MAAKRKSRTTPKASGRKPTLKVDRDEINAALIASIELPPSTMDDADARLAKPVVPKPEPAQRGGRVSAGRGQGAPQARRYAFRRS
ncbi:MAG TPA: hypothetical protein VFX61_18075 [Micromonosporaceae bacterium]|nr:hypothetical protein [Micromonosporaceae bacterium]